MTELNLIDQNKWFSSLKLAVGSKTSSSFNYITKKFNPNDNGYVNNDIKNATIAEILKTMSVGWFIREANKEALKKHPWVLLGDFEHVLYGGFVEKGELFGLGQVVAEVCQL